MTAPQPQYFGLFPDEATTPELARTILPLKAVQSRFVIRGGLAEVEMIQVYRLEGLRPLNCEYLFPLPADAAVYRCTAFINDREIIAQVKEREAARELARVHQAAGRRTVLVEAERNNLFTLSLTNLQPGDFIELTLAYVQPVRGQGREFSFTLPFSPAQRYVPGRPLLRSNRGKGFQDDTDQVPDASRLSPPRIDSWHPDAAILDLQGVLEVTDAQNVRITSPTHALDLRALPGKWEISLARRDEVPAADCVVRWTEPAADVLAGRAWGCVVGAEQFALVEVRAPAVTATSPAPVDTYFLVDRSGSMDGPKWAQAVATLHACVGNMTAGDRVMLTIFGSEYRDFAEAPTAPSQLLQDRNFIQLRTLPSAGGTELASALGHARQLITQHSPGRSALLVLITDAEVANEPASAAVLRDGPAVPVHCFGIDTQVNDGVLLDLIRQQGGTFHAVQPTENITGRIQALSATLRAPVLRDLGVEQPWESATATVPPLHAGQVVYLSLRAPAGVGEAPVLHGRDATGATVRPRPGVAAVTERGPWLQWCRTRLVELVAAGETAAAIELSVAANLVCPLTAFVAWDAAERVVLAREDLVQPVLQETGWAGDPLAETDNEREFKPVPAGGPRLTSGLEHRFFEAAELRARPPRITNMRSRPECCPPVSAEAALVRVRESCMRAGYLGWAEHLRLRIQSAPPATTPRVPHLEAALRELGGHSVELAELRARVKAATVVYRLAVAAADAHLPTAVGCPPQPTVRPKEALGLLTAIEAALSNLRQLLVEWEALERVFWQMMEDFALRFFGVLFALDQAPPGNP